MTKKSYLDAQKKIEVREFLFQQLLFKHVIGLPGPDINEYWRRFIADGCKRVEMYENNVLQAAVQINKLKPDRRVRYRIGDIYNAPADKKDTLYDLDFCCTVKNAIPHIQKFKNNFIMTFSTRYGVKNTVKTFFQTRGERVIKKQKYTYPVEHQLFTTDQGKYIMVRYCDTSAMCSIAKINH